MKVKELIEKLSKFNPDSEVLRSNTENCEIDAYGSTELFTEYKEITILSKAIHNKNKNGEISINRFLSRLDNSESCIIIE